MKHKTIHSPELNCDLCLITNAHSTPWSVSLDVHLIQHQAEPIRKHITLIKHLMCMDGTRLFVNVWIQLDIVLANSRSSLHCQVLWPKASPSLSSTQWIYSIFPASRNGYAKVSLSGMSAFKPLAKHAIRIHSHHHFILHSIHSNLDSQIYTNHILLKTGSGQEESIQFGSDSHKSHYCFLLPGSPSQDGLLTGTV